MSNDRGTYPLNQYFHGSGTNMAGTIPQDHVPAVTGQMGKMSVGPPPTTTVTDNSSRYPGVGQPSNSTHPLGPLSGQAPGHAPLGGTPHPMNHPMANHQMTSSHPSSNPSTGQPPPSFPPSHHHTHSNRAPHTMSGIPLGGPPPGTVGPPGSYPPPPATTGTVRPPPTSTSGVGHVAPPFGSSTSVGAGMTGPRPHPPTSNITGPPPHVTSVMPLTGHHLLPSSHITGPPLPPADKTRPQPSTAVPSGNTRMPSYPDVNGPPPPGPPSNMFGPPGNMSGPSPPTGSMYGLTPPTGNMTRTTTGSLSGPPPNRSMSGPPLPTGNMSEPPPTGSMSGPPPTGNITGLPSTRSNYGPPPTGSMSGPPPTGNMFGPPSTGSMSGPPPIGSMSGPPPTGSMSGPPPTGNITGLPSTGSNYGPPPTGSMSGTPPTGSMSGPPPTGNIIGLPSTGSNYGPPPTGNNYGPPPTGSMSGPPPGMAPSHHVMNRTGSGTLGPPPPSTVAPPPTTSSSGMMGVSAPSARYPRSLSGPEMPNTGMPPNVPGQHQPTYPSPPGGGLVTQKQSQLPELQPVNLLENRHILPSEPLQHPAPNLPGHLSDFVPDPSVFCSSMNTVPASSGLLNKLKLPLAIHIHPFKDSKAKSCPVINPSVIVRCRVCRAYINPYVSFSDARHWRCNLCFRTNVVPEDYDYNPHSGKRGDRTHHVELRHSSVEYIAPSEYMVRPPQPSVYLFLIDVSYPAVESGLLGVFCRVLLECLSRLPGDGRTMVGFLTYDQHLHFYNLRSSQTQPQMLVVSDLNDVFIPSSHSLLVNLRESKELVKNLLEEMPKMFSDQRSGDSALGAALQVAEKLLHPIGGRVTVLQSSLPNVGPGSLKVKEQSQSALKKDQLNIGASTDFYKKLAVECSAQQIAVDLFAFSNPRRFIDLATLSTISKFSSGQISYYSDFHHTRETSIRTVEKDFRRYLTRNIGFEAVMRVRCTEGISLHTFHGNFFVRSTDLLSLPNVNPDHGFCMNLAIDENLKEYPTICCQAALLYTTYRGERRIRVHTLCLPVSEQLSQIYAGINVRAAAAVLAKMAVGRMTTATLGDAREALLNTVQDATKAYRSNLGSSMQSSQFSLPASLKLLPLYVLSLLKHPSLTLNPNVMIDERAYAVNLVLTLPLNYLLANVYPNMYALHTLSEKDVVDVDGEEAVSPAVLQLSAEKLNRYGVYLMDYGKGLYIWVSKDTPPDTVKQLLGVLHFGAIPEFTSDIPVQEYSLSKLTNHLIKQIKMSRQHYMPMLVIREDGSQRKLFVNRLLEDKTEDGTSYYELLSHIARQINK